MKLEAKQRLINADFTFEDNGAPVENCGGNINTAGVDEDAAATLEDQLAHAKKHEAQAKDPELKSAYGRLVSELSRAVTASEADLGPMADTVEANDTSDFMNLTVSDPGNARPVEASFFTKDEALAAYQRYKAEAEAIAGHSLTADDLMALVLSAQEEGPNSKPFNYEEWKNSGKNGFATKLMDEADKKEVTSSEDSEMESDVSDPIGDGEEFNLLVDGDPSQKEPEVSELTQNDGGVQPPTDQPLLLDDVSLIDTN